MKKLILLFLLSGIIPACTFAEPAVIKKLAEGDKFLVLDGLPASEVSSAQLATKLSISNVTQTVTSETNTVPSNKAVTDALALKAGTTNAVLNWTATAGGTNYVYTEFYDATNNVKRFTRNP